MRLIIAGSLLVLSSLAQAQTPQTRSDCKVGSDKVRTMRSIGPQTLGSLPPASEIKTVYRTDERGCAKPVVAREGLGANKDKAVPVEGAEGLTRVR